MEIRHCRVVSALGYTHESADLTHLRSAMDATDRGSSERRALSERWKAQKLSLIEGNYVLAKVDTPRWTKE